MELFGYGPAILSQIVLLIARKVWLVARARQSKRISLTRRFSDGGSCDGDISSLEWFKWLATQLERYSPGKTNLKTGTH
jgi:hypothetical protein